MFYAWYLKVDKFLATLATCLKYLTRLKKYLAKFGVSPSR